MRRSKSSRVPLNHLTETGAAPFLRPVPPPSILYATALTLHILFPSLTTAYSLMPSSSVELLRLPVLQESYNGTDTMQTKDYPVSVFVHSTDCMMAH